MSSLARRLSDLEAKLPKAEVQRSDEQRFLQSRLSKISDESLYVTTLVLATIEEHLDDDMPAWDPPPELAGIKLTVAQADSLFPICEGVVEGKISESDLINRFLSFKS